MTLTLAVLLRWLRARRQIEAQMYAARVPVMTRQLADEDAMNCLQLLQAVSDAESVLVCYAGPDWRSTFVLGLVTVLLVGGAAWVVAMGLRGRA